MLAQDTIIENLNPEEAVRLARVRNIGIAVWIAICPGGGRRMGVGI